MNRDANNSRVVVAIVMLVTVSVVAMPWLAHELPRWNVAHIQNLYRSGKQDVAIRKMEEIVERRPEQWEAVATLANWLNAAHREMEALQLVEDWMNQVQGQGQPIDTSYPGMEQAEMLQVNSLMGMGCFKQALQLFKSSSGNPEKEKRDRQKAYLNQLAYMRGLAGEELELALEGIREVLVTEDRMDRDFYPVGLQPEIRSAINSVLMEHHGERHDRALKRLDEYVAIWNAVLVALPDQVEPVDPLLRFFSQNSRRLTGQPALPNPEIVEQQLQQCQDILCVMLTIRSAIRRETGDERGADQDQKAVLDLGYNPQLIWRSLPEAMIFGSRSVSLAALLDTQAVIYLAMGNPDRALESLNPAIDAQESYLVNVNRLPHPKNDLRTADSEYFESNYVQLQRRNLAVFLYHRAQVYDALGETSKRDADFARIREEFALEPGPRLF